MERFEAPHIDPEKRRLAKLADDAEAYAKTYEPPHHLYKALDQSGITDPQERARLIPEIRKELHRRNLPAGRQGRVPLSKRADLIEDARRLEARHPKEDEDEA